VKALEGLDVYLAFFLTAVLDGGLVSFTPHHVSPTFQE